MAESEVVRIAREYREQLVRNEDEALRRMARSWAKMETQLFDSFKSVSQEIEELQKQGIAIPKQLIYNQRRYQQMLSQVQKYLTEYDETAIQTIKTYQRKNYNLGLDSANATLKATSPSSAVWNEVSRDTAEVMVGFAGNGAPLAELMKRDYGSLAEEITDALVTGIGLGKGAYATAKDMRDAMGMEYNRSVRIARTETNRAYRIANAEQYAKSGVVEKVLRLCYPPTACFACLMMDGEECPNGICDDHPNGKCTTIAVTIGGHYPEWQKGSEWLEQQDEATQRRIMGDARYEMWKKDGVPLRDMVTMKDNPVWGGSPSVLSINDIKQKYNIGSGSNPISLPTFTPPTATPQDTNYKFADMMGNAYKGNKYTDEQRAELEAKYEAMPQFMKEFYKRYGGELEPVLENKYGKVPRKNIDFGYFTTSEGSAGRVHFLAKRDVQGRSDQNPFELGGHEYGHNMDFLAGGKDKVNYLSNQYRDANGKSFLQIINDDFDKAIRTFKGKSDTDSIERSDVTDFCKMIKDTYSKKERGCLSDMFENYSVTHGGSSYPFGIGHGSSYAKRKGNTETEAFAEITESIIFNPESLSVIQKYTPNAYNAFEDMVRKATKK